ncbi:hypothetical protein SLS60_009996 [Paraconiothyrium brasiliense]|uniref:UBA domain-containing protein n=1 Tax=Paraconiothyrium brasiliense TaxID=300254 RepID=A0ABR3QT36_9PLEO
MGKRNKLKRRVETLTNETIVLSNELQKLEELYNALRQDHEALLGRLSIKTNGLYNKNRNNLTPTSPDQTSGSASSTLRVPVRPSKRQKLKRRIDSLTKKTDTWSKRLRDLQDRYNTLQRSHAASLGVESLITQAIALGIPDNEAYAYLLRTDNDINAAANLFLDAGNEPEDCFDGVDIPMEWKSRILQHTSDNRHAALDLWIKIRTHIEHLNAMNRGDDEVWSMLLEAEFDLDRVLERISDEMESSEHGQQSSEDMDAIEFIIDTDDDDLGVLPESD